MPRTRAPDAIGAREEVHEGGVPTGTRRSSDNGPDALNHRSTISTRRFCG
jgi:hypothetical protein